MEIQNWKKGITRNNFNFKGKEDRRLFPWKHRKIVTSLFIGGAPEICVQFYNWWVSVLLDSTTIIVEHLMISSRHVSAVASKVNVKRNDKIIQTNEDAQKKERSACL